MNLMLAMSNAASHFADLMDRKAPSTMRCGIGNRFYEIRIMPHGSGESVHDQVAIRLGGTNNDFVHCGNRCGGRSTLAALYAVDMFEMFGFDALVESVSEDAGYEFDLGLHGDDHVSRQVRTILGITRQEAA